jgi:hypothetical protein
MTHHTGYDAGPHRLYQGDSSLERPRTRESYSAKPSHPQCSASQNLALQQCRVNESNLTKLQRTGIVAAPVDWLPDIIKFECGVVMERYEQHVSEIDDSVDLDRVRRAFVLVRAQARTLATLFVPDIREFLLPRLEGTRQAVLKKWRDLDAAAGGIDDTARVVEAIEEIGKAIMFFDNLMQDVVDHCKIVT